MPIIRPFDRKAFEAWLRRLGRPVPEMTRSVADSVWNEYLTSQERFIEIERRAASLFDAFGSDPNRKPLWTIQPESVKDVFRGFAQSEMVVHGGTGVVYRWNDAKGAYRVVGETQKKEMA